MLFLKSCPRCRGDMYENSDWYGKFTACLQCGFLIDQVFGEIPELRSMDAIMRQKPREGKARDP